MGHATRVIPLIQSFLANGCTVEIACSGRSADLLKQEFPDLNFLHLDGYGIQYPRQGGDFFLKMFFQLPRIVHAVMREHRWLQKRQAVHKWDAVISDNRYGLYHSGLNSVIITHQINVKSGRTVWMDGFIRKCIHAIIRKFDECWIPDDTGVDDLAGDLAHGRLPANARHIGPLSRFDPIPLAAGGGLLILLSGPEPQRTILEALLADQLRTHPIPATIVRGLPGDTELPPDIEQVDWLNHLPAAELQRRLATASLVLARSGYSTIMDLVRTGSRAILIPTPGQTEQLYLGTYLSGKGSFLCFPQEGFDLRKALDAAGQFPFHRLEVSFDRHKDAITRFLTEGMKKK